MAGSTPEIWGSSTPESCSSAAAPGTSSSSAAPTTRPRNFEECLDGIEGVRAGCAVALGYVPPGATDEQLLLLVETADEPPPRLAERITVAVLARTGIRPWTVELLAAGTLPRTSSGKLRRGLALRSYVAGTLAPPGKINLRTVTRELARSAVGFARILLP